MKKSLTLDDLAVGEIPLKKHERQAFLAIFGKIAPFSCSNRLISRFMYFKLIDENRNLTFRGRMYLKQLQDKHNGRSKTSSRKTEEGSE